MTRRAWPRYSERCPGCRRLTILFPTPTGLRMCLDCAAEHRRRPTLLDDPPPPKGPSS